MNALFPQLLFSLFLLGPVFFGASVQAAPAPKDFLGMAWGEPMEKVKAKMLARPNTKLVAETANRLTFSGGEFAGYPIATCELGFGNGFNGARVNFVPAVETGPPRVPPLGRQQFDKFAAALTRKYGGFQSQKARDLQYSKLWTWNVTDTIRKEKGTMNIILTWNVSVPYNFWVSYYRAMSPVAEPMGAPGTIVRPKSGDL